MASKFKDTHLTSAERRNWNAFVGTQCWMVEAAHSRIKRWMALKSGWRSAYCLLSKVCFVPLPRCVCVCGGGLLCLCVVRQVYRVICCLYNLDVVHYPLEKGSRSADRALHVSLRSSPGIEYRCARCARLESQWLSEENDIWVQCSTCYGWLCKECAVGDYATNADWQCISCVLIDGL